MDGTSAALPARAEVMGGDVLGEARETSASTTGLVVAYTRARGGEAALSALLAAAEVPFTVEELSDASRWFSYDTRIRLFQAAVDVFDDPDVPHAMGSTALEHGMPAGIILLLRAVGSPSRVYAQLPSAVSKFSTTSTMRLEGAGPTHAVLDYRLHDGYEHSLLDCRYAQGLIGVVPTLFGLPPARVEHPSCESDGAASCSYEVSWRRRERGWLPGRHRSARAAELTALREQLGTLQSGAADLVAQDDLPAIFARITERAAGAVIAPAHVLAVEGLRGDGPQIHHAGLDEQAAQRIGRALLRGESIGRNAVVVEVATAGRSYGRLAAIHNDGQPAFPGEHSLLRAYANHAAAALELVLSREASRGDAARSRDLLDLAARLGGTTDDGTIADIVADAIPSIVGVPRASVLRWDASAGQLAATAARGLSDDEHAALFAARLRPDDIPELARMLARHEPTVLRAGAQSATLGSVLELAGSAITIAVPLLAGEELLGVCTASTGSDTPPGWPDEDAITRLRGVADHAASALRNCRLLERIRHQADHDGLTGLPNRRRFQELVDVQVRDAPERTQPLGVLFCDLDGFKEVNDRHGHAAGDELLRQVSARLRGLLRRGDVVARLSGDEFALLVLGPSIRELTGEVATRVTDAFTAAFIVAGTELRLSVSVGVTIHHPGDDADLMLRRSDAAMYVAKERGRNQIVSAEAMPSVDSTRVRSRDALVDALAAGEIELHYQPIVSLDPDARRRDDLIVGHEALARWRHPQLGLLTPASFLADAERSGSVIELDLWAVRTAVTAAGDWQRAGHAWHVAVNVCASTLLDARLAPTVRRALVQADLDPAMLTLEIVESRALADLPGVVEQLTTLRRIGVRLALDDFGTGFSTLTWLQRLPIDQIKLDRSFVAATDDDPTPPGLINGVVALARALNLGVVAEGVEHASQLELLREVGCGLVQGYHLGRPRAIPLRAIDVQPPRGGRPADRD